MNPWCDADVSLSPRCEPPRNAAAVDIRRETTTSLASQRQLLLAIRRAAHLRQSLLPHQVNGHSEGDGKRFRGLAPGTEIADFRLVKELGAGAFAKVFLAFHQSMQRLVAIKFSTRPSNEPKLLSSLNHPHIVRVYHYDDQCLSEDGIYVLFMEYVSGVELKRLLQDAATTPISQRSGTWLANYLAQTDADSEWHDRLSLPPHLASATWPEVVAWIGAQIADALGYAHRQNVVHRDVKPANILLRVDGSPMLVDFNVGFGEHVLGASPEDCFGGSPAYMAPEQRHAFYDRAATAALDGRCDIYSLGLVLHEMLTGSLPETQGSMLSTSGFESDHGVASVVSECDGKMSAADRIEACPVGLRDVVTRCLASAVADRPQSADFVARRLRICSSAEVHDFVFARAGTWAANAARHPLFALLGVVLAPHAFFAILNIEFVNEFVNQGFYREVPPGWPLKIGYFTFQELVVNAVVFPLGMYLVAWLARPIVRGLPTACELQSDARPTAVGAAVREAAWQRATSLGYYVWLVALCCWVGTGFVFPTWNWLAKWHYTSTPLGIRNSATFMMTQVTFGAMASALSVLGVNFVLTRGLLPVLVRDDPVPSATYLDSIRRQTQRMVHWLAFVPLFSLLAVAKLNAGQNATLLVTLGLVSGFSYGCGILYARSIRRAVKRLWALLTTAEWK